MKANKRQIEFLLFIRGAIILTPNLYKKVQHAIEVGYYGEEEQVIFNRWLSNYKREFIENQNRVI